MYLQTNNIQWQLSRFLVFVPWKQIKQLEGTACFFTFPTTYRGRVFSIPSVV